MSTNRRIVKNTLILYLRLLLTIGFSLYAVRIVLNAMGVVDFGIFSVVGGIVTVFSFLPAAMASATQRYFSYALGEENNEKLRVLFSMNLVIYLAIGIFALVALETIGLWYVTEKLNIPVVRKESVILLYHYTVFSFMFSMFSSPFMAILISYEDMRTYAYISIAEAALKLLAAVLLLFFEFDKLELYGVALLCVSILITFVYGWVCIKRYSECQIKKVYWDSILLREILTFTGWMLFNSFSTVARTQAVTILLSQVFNPVVVAARAIALQIGGQAIILSQNFNTSLYPPIVKFYAAGNKKELFSLINTGSKITFFLMWLIALPLFIEMEFLLTLWLERPPADAVLFSRLVLLEVLVTSISLPLMTAARATGNIRLYDLILSTMQLLIFPASWFALKLWPMPWVVFAVAIVMNVLMFIPRLLLVRYLVGISIADYVRKVIVSSVIVSVTSLIPVVILRSLLPSNFLFSFIIIIMGVIISMGCIYLLGIDGEWRRKINSSIYTLYSKGKEKICNFKK